MTDTIDYRAEELDRLAQRAVAAYREIADTDGTPLATIIDAVEKAVIEAALREHRTIVHTAAAIGMSRNGLRTKMPACANRPDCRRGATTAAARCGCSRADATRGSRQCGRSIRAAAMCRSRRTAHDGPLVQALSTDRPIAVRNVRPQRGPRPRGGTRFRSAVD